MSPREIDQIAAATRNEEYKRRFLQARREFIELRLKQDLEIRQVYARSADHIAAEIRKLVLKAPSSYIRKQQLEELEKMLRLEAGQLTDDLAAALRRQIHGAVEAGTTYSKGVTTTLFQDAGSTLVTASGINSMFARVNARAVEAAWQRTHKGLKVSDRIWRTGENYGKQLTRLVQESAAAGQDAVKTARMLERYVKQGTGTLLRDYPEAWERLKGRVPKDISYEALRLARTEATAAFGQASINSARLTPSYVGIKYCLSAQHRIYDICDVLATADEDGLGPGVYAAGNEPVYPAHPNTLSFLVPVHTQPEEMADKIKEWTQDPAAQPDLENWYNNVYKGFSAGPPGGIIREKAWAEKPLPGLERAYIAPPKLLKYSLDKEHPRGKNKAIVFERVLGYDPSTAGRLERDILDNLPYYNAVDKGRDQYGHRYQVIMALTGPNGNTADVVTAWRIKTGKDFPELVTTLVAKKKKVKK
ncbi:MAG: DUF6883 domain-containing protein [Bacillota bacterium]